eukprot:TRINITY_DN531_c0_g1_i1.p1 TRINITY_DN531_c0_g1~~TRINITY_DN531_c0_g1_i1.p1  ORF type:complete len:142 (-),score=16.35 TRINITY_DN531_c0_g1_i1:418-843(-)
MFKVVLLLSLISIVLSQNTCGGNCPSGDCPAGECYCGEAQNPVDVSSMCSQYSGWSQECCNCIANAESGGNANAENYNSNGSYDIGLWQINDSNWGSGSCPSGAPCDPNANLQCAIQVWKWGGNTWRLWSTCGQCGCCSSP